jgi:hypothetical protein
MPRAITRSTCWHGLSSRPAFRIPWVVEKREIHFVDKLGLWHAHQARLVTPILVPQRLGAKCKTKENP